MRKLTLEKAHVVVRRDGRCQPALPVIVGRDHGTVRKISQAVARHVDNVVRAATGQLADVVRNDAVLFQLLWSRLLDQSWDEAWAAAFPRAVGPTETTWILYPAHPYSVGTNYNDLPGGGELAVTWSPTRSDHVRPIMLARYDIGLAAWRRRLPAVASRNLRALGIVGDTGTFEGLRFHAGDRLDLLLQRLRQQYATAAISALNLQSVSRRLGIAPSEALIIVLHEVAYDVLEALDRSGRVRYPAALRRADRREAGRDLASARLRSPPSVADEAVAAFIRRGGRGDHGTVAVIRDALRTDSTDQTLWMYLGLSLYETGEYRAALDAFRHLNALAAQSTDSDAQRMHEWSRIWMGHMQDLLGLRDEAIATYRDVLNGTSVMQHAQYGIGPVSAGDWARERLKTPFAKR